MKGVIAVSLHVDYWDYLGWRDTLGDNAYTKRQHDYARRRKDGDVYTPQIVINGTSHHVGSDKSSVRTAIKRARTAMPSLWVPLRLSSNGTELIVTAEAHDNAPTSTLWLMAITPSIVVKILRGENAGREIIYYNVVRKLMPASMWHGEAISLKLPLEGLMTSDSKACVVLLQSGMVGPVIGAATWGDTIAGPAALSQRDSQAASQQARHRLEAPSARPLRP
jgi:hypothetical protein